MVWSFGVNKLVPVLNLSDENRKVRVIIFSKKMFIFYQKNENVQLSLET